MLFIIIFIFIQDSTTARPRLVASVAQLEFFLFNVKGAFFELGDTSRYLLYGDHGAGDFQMHGVCRL